MDDSETELRAKLERLAPEERVVALKELVEQLESRLEATNQNDEATGPINLSDEDSRHDSRSP